ncbi:MAG: RNA methyltransferase [Phycisphaerales bacterium]|nr:RNA methyltransferase [Phycisphaerales bacterium]
MAHSYPNISIISSLDDPRIDPYRNIKDADLRGRKHLFMVESEMVVRRLLSTDWNIHSLFLSPEKCERLAPVFSNLDVPVYVADVSLMTKITGFHIHRGVLAAAHRPSESSMKVGNLIKQLKDKERVSLLLAEGITNVDNMGALFRNAAGFGVDALVFDQRCCDPLYRKAIRVSMGHVLSLPWAFVDDWKLELQLLKQELELTLIGCETSVDSKPIWEIQPSNRFGLIMGEEKSGLSSTTMELCDEIAEIPMTPKVPSINVAVASAVGLYEFLCRSRLDKR